MTTPCETEIALLARVESLMEACEFAEAEARLKHAIYQDPLKSSYFHCLSEVCLRLGRVEAASVAARRCQQLKQIEANTKPAPSVEQYEALEAYRENSADLLEFGGHSFPGLRMRRSSSGLEVLCGISEDGCAFLKVFVNGVSGRVARECAFLEGLSERGAVSGARVLGSGMLRHACCAGLPAWSGDSGDSGESGLRDGGAELPYIVLEYARADRGGFGIADVILSLLEQQGVGIYPNCISLSRIRFDSIQAVCRFSGYESAVWLDAATQSLSPRAYIDWCVGRELERTGTDVEPSFLVGNQGVIGKYFEGDRFLLGATQLFGRQRMADVPVPSVQTVSTSRVLVHGSLPVDDRIELLSDFPVRAGERILDLGCGAGGLSLYLAERGGAVTAVDSDGQVVQQCQLLSRVEGLAVEAQECDLAYDFPDGAYDLVCVLGLLPNLESYESLCLRVEASGCRRVLVEVGLKELGFRWQGAHFLPVQPGVWQFEDADALERSVVQWFPRFGEVERLGVTATGRQLFCLTRTEGEGG